MKIRPYTALSRRLHLKNIATGRPSACQMELTFRCALACRHCYTACYKTRAYQDRELSTRGVKDVLNKVRDAGVLWLCLTGGDPWQRRDFPEIYRHARGLGLIVTVFTSAFQLPVKVLKALTDLPPFVVETTVNAADSARYDRISGVRGSFVRVRKNLGVLRDRGIPLRIKMQVMKDNEECVSGVRDLAASLGACFSASRDISPRIDGDASPCQWRPELRTVAKRPVEEGGCGPRRFRASRDLFLCAAVSGDSFFVDPEGRMFLCHFLRHFTRVPKQRPLRKALAMAAARAGKIRLPSGAACVACARRASCPACPGRAFVETGDMTAAVTYYCRQMGHVPVGRRS